MNPRRALRVFRTATSSCACLFSGSSDNRDSPTSPSIQKHEAPVSAEYSPQTRSARPAMSHAASSVLLEPPTSPQKRPCDISRTAEPPAAISCDAWLSDTQYDTVRRLSEYNVPMPALDVLVDSLVDSMLGEAGENEVEHPRDADPLRSIVPPSVKNRGDDSVGPSAWEDGAGLINQPREAGSSRRYVPPLEVQPPKLLRRTLSI